MKLTNEDVKHYLKQLSLNRNLLIPVNKIMKYIIQNAAVCFLLLTINSFQAKAQILHPVKWSFSLEQSESETTLLLKATIEKPWHLYSQDIGEGGPIPTSFKFTASDDYELIGKVVEPPAESFHDPNFDMDLKTLQRCQMF